MKYVLFRNLFELGDQEALVLFYIFKVNESVTEEIGPDGSKIIRRHQQEKQINKITQVVTQRVIKRQYIDPNTGQIIEYNPNNELFANLPPETVFEEHTIISDDVNGGTAPVVTTTTVSKSTPSLSNSTSQLQAQAATASQTKLVHQNKLPISINNLSLNDSNSDERNRESVSEKDTVDNLANIYTNNIKNQQSASFRIKSHPEDNQGYPEEKNMDYDPDDINLDDDELPYEGLTNINKTSESSMIANTNNNMTDHATRGGSGSGAGSTTGSSSPLLFDPNNPDQNGLLYSNGMQQMKSGKHIQGNMSGGSYVAVPSANLPTPRSNYHQYKTYHMEQSEHYSAQQMQGFPPNIVNSYKHRQQISPSLNNSNNEYGNNFFSSNKLHYF
jgi:hypothetical protein